MTTLPATACTCTCAACGKRFLALLHDSELTPHRADAERSRLHCPHCGGTALHIRENPHICVD